MTHHENPVAASVRAQRWGRTATHDREPYPGDVALGTQMRIAIALERIAEAIESLHPVAVKQKERDERKLQERTLRENQDEQEISARIRMWMDFGGPLPSYIAQQNLFETLRRHVWVVRGGDPGPLPLHPPAVIGSPKTKYQAAYSEWRRGFLVAVGEIPDSQPEQPVEAHPAPAPADKPPANADDCRQLPTYGDTEHAS